MNWALLREEASVAEIEEASVAEKYDAALDELRREGKFKGEPPSVGLLTYIDISLARPHLKPGQPHFVADNVADNVADMEQALVDAIAAGRIRTNKDGLLRAEDVRREFPAITGKGRGRGSRRHFDAEAIERLAAHIRDNPKPPDANLTELHSRDNPDTLSEKLQLPIMDKDAFPAFVRCAIEFADNWLRNRSSETSKFVDAAGVVTVTRHHIPKEWALSPAELEQQSHNIDTWRIRRGRLRGSRR